MASITLSIEDLKKDSLIVALFNAFEKARKRNWQTIYVFVDLHDTVLGPSYSKDDISRQFHDGAIECLQYLTSRPDVVLILFTSSKNDHIEQYKKMFAELAIHFTYTNENPAEANTAYADFSKKPYMSLMLDDKAGFDASKHWHMVTQAAKTIPILEAPIKRYEVASAVMRIQSHDGPHEGHMELIAELFKRGKRVLIFLARDRSHPSRRNPLSFEVRKELLDDAIHNSPFQNRRYEVLPFSNHESSEVWSHELDKAIADHLQKPDISAGDVVYLNSRDGFGKHYFAYGIHPVVEIKEIPGKNATAIRESVLEEGVINKDVARGMVLQQMLQPDALLLLQTRAFITNDSGEVYVVSYHSTDEKAFRFPGGYVSAKKDETSRASLLRKLNTKLALAAGKDAFEFPPEKEHMKFIDEVAFSDWRHRESGARIILNLFHVPTKYAVIIHPVNRTKVASGKFVPKSELKNVLHPEEHFLIEYIP